MQDRIWQGALFGTNFYLPANSRIDVGEIELRRVVGFNLERFAPCEIDAAEGTFYLRVTDVDELAHARA